MGGLLSTASHSLCRNDRSPDLQSSKKQKGIPQNETICYQMDAGNGLRCEPKSLLCANYCL